jgi:hypothetical protein
LVTQCSAIAGSGERCRGVAVRGSDLCAAHDPSTQERRRAGARRGGRKRPGAASELTAVKDELRETIEAVRDGSMERGTGAVIGGLYNTLLRALETQRKWYETDELERRLQLLEEQAEHEREASSWG